MAANPEGCLYIIKSEEGPVKIGISIDPKERIRALSATSGRGIIQSFISPVLPHSDQLERSLHAHFALARTYGEWFNIEFDDAVRAAHHLGARTFPDRWRHTADYMDGARHRARMREFAQVERTTAEWEAFFAGMGDYALAQAEMADDVDQQAALIGMAQLQLMVDAAAGQPAMEEAVSAIMCNLRLVRESLDADMVAAGLTPSGGLKKS